MVTDLSIAGLGALPPAGPADLIDRLRLHDRLDEVGRTLLTVVRAPAGYGKTSLLLQWHRTVKLRGARATWFALSEAQREPHPIHKLVDEPAFLFIDAAQHLSNSNGLAWTRSLIDRAPRQLHIVLATRERVDIPLGKLRAAGALTEIGPEELRFDRDEVEELLMQAGLSGLPNDSAERLRARTEGWGAGLRLAIAGLRTCAQPGQTLETFCGEWRTVTEFFDEEVFNRESPGIQDFLLKTSILERLSPDLCDAVTAGTAGRVMLSECEARGLFLTALNQEHTWYRYDRLFAEYLRRRARDRAPESISALRLRGSAWLCKEGHPAEAFDQALLAGDQLRAAEILDSLSRGNHFDRLEFLRLAQQLAPQTRNAFPRISMAMATPLIITRKLAAVHELLIESRRQLEQIRAANKLPPEEVRDLELLLVHREMMLSLVQDDMGLTDTLCDTLMREYGKAPPEVKASVYTSLIQVKCDRYDYSDIERLEGLARAQAELTDNPMRFIPLESAIAQYQFMRGRGGTVVAALHRKVDSTIVLKGATPGHVAMLALPLAEICYELNDIQNATQLTEAYVPGSREFGFIEALLAGRLTHSRILRLAGDVEGAVAALGEIPENVADRGMERLRLSFSAERICLLCGVGQPEEAARIAQEVGLDCEPESLLSPRQMTTRDEARARGWVRMARAQNRFAEALKVARYWRSFATAARAVRSSIFWDVQLALLLVLDGQSKAAVRTLRQAISSATSTGYLRTFLDAGSVIGTLLVENPALASSADPAMNAFAIRLRAAFEAQMHRSVAGARTATAANETQAGGSFNNKELEILQMIGLGMRNAEIGASLGMSESTVKWYVQQVFEKTGTRRRMHAVTQARRLGLLD